MIDLHPWPWYIAGPLVGITVPILLLWGNKKFGISSTLSHICAACIPIKPDFFNYNWRAYIWNLWFVAGIAGGAFLASLTGPHGIPSTVAPDTVAALQNLGIKDFTGLLPGELFTWSAFAGPQIWILSVAGGFLVGFGTRYAGGCTSGHSIMGLSALQWPSLVATCCFMIGGFFTTHILLPLIFAL